MQIFGYFHKSRLLYGLPAFVDQNSWINRVENIMIKNIKLLLRLPKRTDHKKLKIALGILDLNVYINIKIFKTKN